MKIKMRIIPFFLLLLAVQFVRGQIVKQKSTGNKETGRTFWLQEMDRMLRPVLRSLAHDSLRLNMPQMTSNRVDNREHRIKVQYVEVLGRALSGIAPWLSLNGGSVAERKLRDQYRTWTIQALKNALDSNARDFMRFDLGGQQLVDASFIALGFMRSPWLWDHLDQQTRKNLIASIKITRQFRPAYSNWLLFSAMNEVFLAKYSEDWDAMRVDYALQQLEQWYVGDGMYMDGPQYAFDYYNSYVIHPFLAGIMDLIQLKTQNYDNMFAKIKLRNERYAIIQERLINADGSFPPTGRSVIYRAATFHHLADMAFKKRLPRELTNGQVRGALSAVLKKTTENPSTYQNGWLTLGMYGSQPGLADSYNNQGSPYLCSVIFLPLGLPDDDPFWTSEVTDWSAKRIWSGQDWNSDHSKGIH
ncbi:MAG: DUF2264 domain-containing protein [Sphingobacterium sp.]|jgi:hypothetical protein|uniref:DUF2264 domain-containing protein n=1 Tax=Sphingobacterium sp. TaxID=341027 RepID=UPI00283D690C|nr:DUF2264 domain-containing protein [Sphingobacterium sp.]MDR3008025.1 DUF2264 domain-containing protein [Sphingobacterium sp.]